MTARAAATVLALVERMERQSSRLGDLQRRLETATPAPVATLPPPRAGRGIADVLVDPSGDLIVRFTDGSKRNAGRVRGRDGDIRVLGGGISEARVSQMISAALAGYVPGAGASHIAAVPLSALRAVQLAPDGLRYASRADAATADAVLGLTPRALLAGESAVLIASGEVEDGGWSFTPQEPVLLGADGHLSQVPPSESDVYLPLGFALTPTRVLLRIGTPVFPPL